ncbi:MAG: autotransporter assembly complex family protein [Paracoccaceae bacterium]
MLAGAALAGCAGDEGTFSEPVDFEAPETTVAYEPVVEGAPSEEIAELVRESALVFRRRGDGAQSLAFLRRRAQGDVDTVQRILRAYGYYEAEVEVEIEELVPDPEGGEVPEGAEPSGSGEDVAGGEAVSGGGFFDFLPTFGLFGESFPDPEARVTLAIEPGPAFTLARHDFALSGFEPGAPPALGPAIAYGSPVGMPAEAAPILNAENAAVAAARGQGFYYADSPGRDAVADLDEDTIEVETPIATGRAYRFGPTTITGSPNVETEYLRTYIPWAEGELVDAGLMAEYQRALLGTGLFRSGFVTLPDTPPEGEVAPVTVELEEAPVRSVALGARFSTDEGPGARALFEHRNLFGANETLRLTLEGTIDEQTFLTEYREPQFLRPGQDLVSSLEFRRIEEDQFDELGATFQLGLARIVSERWTVGFGGLIEVSQITDMGEEQTAYLFGIPLNAVYDSTESLLNPVDGERFGVQLTPFGGFFDDEPVGFGVIDAFGRIYRPLDRDEDFVVAARTRLGAIPSGSLDDVPPTRRLYSGGAGSVRGYAEDFIGPLDDNNDPIGGRSVIEAGLELRYPIVGDLGGVVFTEGGSVSTEIVPDFDEGFQLAAGAGFRYYSPVGPIRLDFAFPVNGRDADDTFQFYISIGQAF